MMNPDFTAVGLQDAGRGSDHIPIEMFETAAVTMAVLPASLVTAAVVQVLLLKLLLWLMSAGRS